MLLLFGMQLTWYGQSCFKIESKDIVLVTDPFDKSIGLTPPRFRADIALVSHDHPAHANTESLQGLPFVIAGPGEYEVKGVMVRGIQTFHDAAGGKERGSNTVYIIRMEGMTICHMGDFGEEGIREEIVDHIGDVDILLLPVGGGRTIDGRAAARIVRAIEPRIAVPMHYKVSGVSGSLDSVDGFLKEMGVKEKKAEEKLSVKKKELPEEEMRVVILETAR